MEKLLEIQEKIFAKIEDQANRFETKIENETKTMTKEINNIMKTLSKQEKKERNLRKMLNPSLR